MTSSRRRPARGLKFRPGRTGDIPKIAELIAAAELPAAFIAEFLDGFVVAERDGAVIACGGVEMYETCAVIRSVVVDDNARGAGIGRMIADRLIRAARARGATDLYLFTAQAHGFWLRLGFKDVDYHDWKAPARGCWQYVFLSQNRDIVPDIHTMWRRALR